MSSADAQRMSAADKVLQIDQLAEGDPSLDERDDTDLGYTALGLAAREGYLDVVKRLLELGADIHAGDSINGTPLHHTGVTGQTAVAEELLRAGARVDAVDDMGTTPLIRASKQVNAARIFFPPIGDEIFTPIPASGTTRPRQDPHLTTVKILLTAGANPDLIANDGYSALHHAADNGAVALIKLLIKSNANVNQQNGVGGTALHVACDSKQTAVVRALLNAGADPNLADSYGFVALHGAACQGADKIAEHLLKAGADTTPKTTDAYDKVTAGMTPADVARTYGHDRLARTIGEWPAQVG